MAVIDDLVKAPRGWSPPSTSVADFQADACATAQCLPCFISPPACPVCSPSLCLRPAEQCRRQEEGPGTGCVCSRDTGSLTISLVASDILGVLQNSHTGSSSSRSIVSIGFVFSSEEYFEIIKLDYILFSGFLCCM